MAKWQSPRQQFEREVARLVAQYRPAAQAAVDALTADWTAVPDGSSNLIYRAVQQALVDAGMPMSGDVAYAAKATLQDELAKPFVARWHQEKRAAEKAAASAVDRNRPVVAQCDGTHRIGELVILRDSATHTQRVLVCIGIEPVRDDEYGTSGAWLSNLAEPNDTEQATADYQRLAAKVDAENAQEQAQMEQQRTRHEAARQASLADGHEPTLLDDLFAGEEDH